MKRPWMLGVALELMAVAVLGCGSGTLIDPGDAAGDSSSDGAPDAVVDAPPVGAVRWISDDGDDLAAGTESAPWGSFTHAIAQLTPGDTLVVKANSSFRSFRYDCDNGCSGGCPSGEPGAPITVRAEIPRTVRFENGLESAFTLWGCSHVVIEGFELSQQEGATASTFERIVTITQSDHVVFRDMVVHSINRWINGHMIMLTASSHVLVEDSELYDFHRGGLNIIGSEHVTVRRLYVNSRDRANLTDPMAYTCCCDPGGDYGIWVDESFDVTIENAVIERTCQSVLVGADGDDVGARGGTGLRILGSVALDSRDGFVVGSSCDDLNPCPEERRARDVEIVHSAAIASSNDGFRINGVTNAVIRNVTSIDGGTDYDIEVSGTNVAVDDASFLVVNALDDGSEGVGYNITGQAEGTILSSNSFGNTTDFDPMFPATGHRFESPALGECRVYVPDDSPMRGAGAGGEDIGARISHRYVDGRLTSEPLWDATTGAFPCGPVIPGGINDEATHPGGTCTTVHERLNVGAAGCPLP